MGADFRQTTSRLPVRTALIRPGRPLARDTGRTAAGGAVRSTPERTLHPTHFLFEPESRNFTKIRQSPSFRRPKLSELRNKNSNVRALVVNETQFGRHIWRRTTAEGSGERTNVPTNGTLLEVAG